MGDRHLRVFSFNAMGKEDITRRCFQFVNEGNADIFLIQEANTVFAFLHSDCTTAGSLVNIKKGFEHINMVKKNQLVILTRANLHLETQISSNCDSVLAATFRSPTGLLFGVVNVHIRRADAERSVYYTDIYPNILNLIGIMKFGALSEEASRSPRANVVIFGGDLNSLTEDQIDFETVRAARPHLPAVYFLKSRVVRGISKIFKLGTMNEVSGRNWTRGFYIFDDTSYYDTTGPDVILLTDVLKANFESFLRWRIVNGYNQDLLFEDLTPRELEELINVYGFAKTNILPNFKFLYQHYIDNGHSFSDLTIDDYIILREPNWIDVLFFSDNCRITSYTFPRRVIDFWPRTCDHRPVSVIIDIISDYGTVYVGDPIVDAFITSIDRLMLYSTPRRLEQFKRLFSPPDRIINMANQINITMA